jgi:NADH-quinone oxidoreductase subunit N
MASSMIAPALPFLILAATPVIVMLLIAHRRDHRRTASVTAAGLVASLTAILLARSAGTAPLTPLFLVDGYTLFFLFLILASTLAVLMLSYSYLERMHDGPYDEYYLLLLLTALGAAALLASLHFAGFFLGLETLSLGLIGLIAYPRQRERALEAGLKYLILTGVSSAFLLFGMALIYLDYGTMSFTTLGRLWDASPTADIYAYAGFALLLTGIGFKLSLVPFHMWAPDIYEGAPAPVTSLVAVVSKIAIFALLFRFFVLLDGYRSPSLLWVLSLIAIPSMLAGNLLALLQDNLKRIFAYASISHVGYVLVALLAGSATAFAAALTYLAAYAVTMTGVFGIITLLSQPGSLHDADRLETYRGLMWERPWLAGAFTVMLLSLAGLPPTMGFIAEVYVIAAGVGAYLALPLAALIIGSAIGLYYYLRIIVVMLSPAPGRAALPARARLGTATVAVLLVVLVWLGIYPAPMIAGIQQTVASLSFVPPATRNARDIFAPQHTPPVKALAASKTRDGNMFNF